MGVVRIRGAGVARLDRPRRLCAAGKEELWERWKAGESISDISRALKKPPAVHIDKRTMESPEVLDRF